MKKLIVTGGLGFIGSNLIEILLRKNFYVINLDKITYSSNFYNTKEFKKSNFYQPQSVMGQKIKSVGLVAGFDDFKSDICLGEIGFF